MSTPRPKRRLDSPVPTTRRPRPLSSAPFNLFQFFTTDETLELLESEIERGPPSNPIQHAALSQTPTFNFYGTAQLPSDIFTFGQSHANTKKPLTTPGRKNLTPASPVEKLIDPYRSLVLSTPPPPSLNNRPSTPRPPLPMQLPLLPTAPRDPYADGISRTGQKLSRSLMTKIRAKEAREGDKHMIKMWTDPMDDVTDLGELGIEMEKLEIGEEQRGRKMLRIESGERRRAVSVSEGVKARVPVRKRRGKKGGVVRVKLGGNLKREADGGEGDDEADELEALLNQALEEMKLEEEMERRMFEQVGGDRRQMEMDGMEMEELMEF